MENLIIKPVEKNELKLLLDMIIELADYEDAANEVHSTVESLEIAIFKENVAKALIVHYKQNPVGYVIYNFNFSTFTGKIGVFIDDLYIRENYRGLGLGKQLFSHIGKIAKSNNCGRMDWYCMKTNLATIEYYQHMNAETVEWVDIYRLDEEKINKLIS